MNEREQTDSQHLRHVTDILINFENRIWVKAQERGLTKKDLQITAEILHQAQNRAISKARELEFQGNPKDSKSSQQSEGSSNTPDNCSEERVGTTPHQSEGLVFLPYDTE
jgi:hypothetical protein